MPTFASEKSAYYDFTWLDQDKEIYVLQNRKYRKDERAYVVAGYGITTSGAFVDASTIQGRAGYFITEDYGIELVYAKNSGEENGTAKSVRQTAAGTIPFRRIVESYMGGMFMWSPFYAKVNMFNKVFYYDWIIGLGYGKLEEKNNRLEFDNAQLVDTITESHSGPMWDIAFQFYLSQNFNIRADLTVLHYSAKKAEEDTSSGSETSYTNYDLVLSLGYIF